MEQVENETPEQLTAGLVRLLQVEALDDNLYRGGISPERWARVFGGQVVAQALAAATGTVAVERAAHSLHAYFMRPGDPDHPILFEVSRDRDGGSFSTRRVVALQHGKPILNLAASFHVPQSGLEHQAAMPDVPPPEALEDEFDVINAMIEAFPEWRRPQLRMRRALQFRPVVPGLRYRSTKHAPVQHFWFRIAAPLPDDPRLHRVMLAYASDMMLVSTTVLPHSVAWYMDQVEQASLDHALWLHGEARADEWLLYSLDSPWAGGGRGLARGQIFTRDGRLVASTAQEGLIRPR